MATIKSYSDLEQSKKLAEILPIESADMHYRTIINGTASTAEKPKLGSIITEWDIPCWSLAALLKIIGHYTLQTVSNDKKVFIVSEENYPICSDNYSEPLDACVAIIEKLNELNLL